MCVECAIDKWRALQGLTCAAIYMAGLTMAEIVRLNFCMFTLCANLVSTASWWVHLVKNVQRSTALRECSGNVGRTGHMQVCLLAYTLPALYSCCESHCSPNWESFLSSSMMSFHCWQVSLIIPSSSSMWLPRAMLTAAQKAWSRNFPPKIEELFNKLPITLEVFRCDG